MRNPKLGLNNAMGKSRTYVDKKMSREKNPKHAITVAYDVRLQGNKGEKNLAINELRGT